MRGSPKRQVAIIFNESGIDARGTSKHQAKTWARDAGARTWSDMGKTLGIHSHNTADAYRETWHRCFRHARENHGLKAITQMEAKHVQSYLDEVIEKGCSRATYSQYAAGLGKLERALNMYAEKTGMKRRFELRSGIAATREDAKHLKRFSGTRAYDNPVGVTKFATNSEHQLAAKMMFEGGSRVNEIALIRPGQLRGEGRIEVQGKGGKILTPCFGPETYGALVDHLERHGEFRINKDAFRRDLKNAAQLTGQAYQGSHGLRWNFAQRRMLELREQGVGYYESLGRVSKEMGHERPDITEHYLA